MKIDGWTLLIIIIMTLCLAIACFVYYEKKVDTCNSNPLSYASKILENQYGFEFVGYGHLVLPENFNQQTYYFNSTGVYPVNSIEIL